MPARRPERTIERLHLYEDEPAASPAELRQLERLRPRIRSECTPCHSCCQFLENGTELTCNHDPTTAFRHCRPCIFSLCRHNLYIDLRHGGKDGRAVIQSPDGTLNSMRATCALDVAEHGGLTLDAVGSLLGVTRERIRQIEAEAMLRFKRSMRR